MDTDCHSAGHRLLRRFRNLIAPYDPRDNDVRNKLQPPFTSSEHILGSDRLGKDMLSRLIFGARTMLQVTAPSMVVAILAGTVVGLVSGYSGRWVDSILMRITDAVLGFPSILVALLIVTYLGTGVWNVMIAIAATQWARFARMIRGEVLSVRGPGFCGAGPDLRGVVGDDCLAASVPQCHQHFDGADQRQRGAGHSAGSLAELFGAGAGAGGPGGGALW